MPKHLAALLSLFGLAATAGQAEAQVLKGSVPPPADKKPVPAAPAKATRNGTAQTPQSNKNDKLVLKQNTIRNANGNNSNNTLTKGAGKKGDPLTPSAYCNTAAKGNANQQLTKANNNQITKANNNQITKANNNQITKGNNQIMKANNNQITKGNNQLTKANKQQLTPPPPQNR
jgi:hypothetical protein